MSRSNHWALHVRVAADGLPNRSRCIRRRRGHFLGSGEVPIQSCVWAARRSAIKCCPSQRVRLILSRTQVSTEFSAKPAAPNFAEGAIIGHSGEAWIGGEREIHTAPEQVVSTGLCRVGEYP